MFHGIYWYVSGLLWGRVAANIDKATLDSYKLIGEGKSVGSIPPATYLQVKIARCNSSNLTLLTGSQTMRRKDISMAENSFQKSSITIEAAERVVKAAETKAREMGKSMSIAVCDEDGVLKAFRRMDGAALLSVQIAQDKAYKIGRAHV